MLEYATIGLITLFAAISPGPDFIVVAKNALSHYRQAAIMTSIGVGAGIFFHTCYCILGLAFIMANSLIIFETIKYMGACYLIYLGIKNILSQGVALHTETIAMSINSISLWRAFCEGFLTNCLNPKCALFMLSIFTVVINPTTPQIIQASYGVEIAFITGGWFVFLSYGLSHKTVRNMIKNVQGFVNKAIGIILIGLGFVVVFG